MGISPDEWEAIALTFAEPVVDRAAEKAEREARLRSYNANRYFGPHAWMAG